MITVFTRQGCAPCQTLKYWLSKKNVAYEEVSFDKNPEAYPEGFTIFPLVRVGEEFVEGLNLPHLARLIQL